MGNRVCAEAPGGEDDERRHPADGSSERAPPENSETLHQTHSSFNSMEGEMQVLKRQVDELRMMTESLAGTVRDVRTEKRQLLSKYRQLDIENQELRQCLVQNSGSFADDGVQKTEMEMAEDVLEKHYQTVDKQRRLSEELDPIDGEAKDARGGRDEVPLFSPRFSPEKTPRGRYGGAPISSTPVVRQLSPGNSAPSSPDSPLQSRSGPKGDLLQSPSPSRWQPVLLDSERQLFPQEKSPSKMLEPVRGEARVDRNHIGADAAGGVGALLLRRKLSELEQPERERSPSDGAARA